MHAFLEFQIDSIFTMGLRDYVAMYVSLPPPKLLDQSKNVPVRTFHSCPGIVHEHIFLAENRQKL